MKKSYFLKRRSFQHTLDMLMIHLPSLITKLKQMTQITFEKDKENVYRFLMSKSKEQMLALKLVYTKNSLSLANIYVGSPVVF